VAAENRRGEDGRLRRRVAGCFTGMN